MATRSSRTTLTPCESSGGGPPPEIFAPIGKTKNIDQAVGAKRAMSHALPIKFWCLLSSGEMMAPAIANAVGSTRSKVTWHLGILRACGMMNSRKQPPKVFYRIDEERIVKMISVTRDILRSV